MEPSAISLLHTTDMGNNSEEQEEINEKNKTYTAVSVAVRRRLSQETSTYGDQDFWEKHEVSCLHVVQDLNVWLVLLEAQVDVTLLTKQQTAI